jgi:hypothetical protein
LREGRERKVHTQSIIGRAARDNAWCSSLSNGILCGAALASVVGDTTSCGGDGVGQASESTGWQHSRLAGNGLGVGD